MEIEDYFESISPEEIRLKGTRIGIEHILYEYIYCARTAETIAKQFPTVTLAQVYATILYYLENQPKIEKYVGDWLAYCLRTEAEYDRHPSAFVRKLRQIKQQRSDTRKVEQFY